MSVFGFISPKALPCYHCPRLANRGPLCHSERQHLSQNSLSFFSRSLSSIMVLFGGFRKVFDPPLPLPPGRCSHLHRSNDVLTLPPSPAAGSRTPTPRARAASEAAAARGPPSRPRPQPAAIPAGGRGSRPRGLQAPHARRNPGVGRSGMSYAWSNAATGAIREGEWEGEGGAAQLKPTAAPASRPAGGGRRPACRTPALPGAEARRREPSRWL